MVADGIFNISKVLESLSEISSFYIDSMNIDFTCGIIIMCWR